MASSQHLTTDEPLDRRQVLVAGVLTMAGLPAGFPTEPVRSADAKDDPAARKKSMTSLRKIAVALHNYHDAVGWFPPAAVYDKDGRPLYSWRVLILPHVGEAKLYEQFKLDEPWDSPHNKKLLAKMPEVFGPVEGEARKQHATYYQLFVGPDTAFPETKKNRGPSMAVFRDGVANTFLVVEAGQAVPWTAPRDVRYDPKKPVPKLGGLFLDGFDRRQLFFPFSDN
jgi:hypothetical protein